MMFIIGLLISAILAAVIVGFAVLVIRSLNAPVPQPICERICAECEGKGFRYHVSCVACDGTGWIRLQ